MERACKSWLCAVACRGNRDGCIGEERSYGRRNTTVPRPTATAVQTIEIVYGEMAACIVATTCHTAYQQGAQGDRQTVAAFDQHETPWHISTGSDTNCHRLLRYGRIQGVYREIQKPLHVFEGTAM